MKGNIYFVSGIDTDIGKSYATGYIARTWNGQGVRTITRALWVPGCFRKTARALPCQRYTPIPAHRIWLQR